MQDAINPKDQAGAVKLPLHLVSPLLAANAAVALNCGAVKYGAGNYLETPVYFSVYLGAIQRHLAAIISGEELDAEGVPHIGSIAANLDIILSSQAAGVLVDDRKFTKGVGDALKELEGVNKNMVELREKVVKLEENVMPVAPSDYNPKPTSPINTSVEYNGKAAGSGGGGELNISMHPVGRGFTLTNADLRLLEKILERG